MRPVTGTWLLLAPLAAVLVPGLHGRAEPERAQLRAVVDPRVELISIVFRLAGNPEYNQGRLEGYLEDVEAHFGPHRDHELIEYARSLRRENGISYDACMSMAVHLKADDVSLRPRGPFDEADALEPRWRPDTAARFVELLDQFAEAAEFGAFFEAHRELYELSESRMNALLAQQLDQGWYERFYGGQAHATFELILAPVNGGQAYGTKYVAHDGIEHLYAIMGIWKTDPSGDPAFSDEVIPTIVHEFCHSFANVRVERHANQLEEAGKELYALVADKMRRQAYGNWKTMMCESLVRASVTRYVLEHEGELGAEQHMRAQEQRGFLWHRDLVELLAEYEGSRDRYPDLDAFMPRMVEFFAARPEIARDDQAQGDGNRPMVTAVTPPDGSEDVDPALEAIVVTFDLPMKKSWSFMISPELGRGGFPRTTGDPWFNEDRTVITLPVKLVPGRTYELWLNYGSGTNFRSAQGVSLEPYRIRFKTRER